MTTRAIVTQQALLQAAVEEWSSNGDIEVAAVARRAGVSAGLPYRYFGTRAGLLIALVELFYDRLADAAAMRHYEEPTFAARERRRTADWVAFLYREPLAPLVLAGPVGDGTVIAQHLLRLDAVIAAGARNLIKAQDSDELPAGRDPWLLAAATLSGVHAMSVAALTRQPRPAQSGVVAQVWAFVVGAIGLPAESAGAQ